ncbi:HNH endonuclease signature motif containing protein [Microbacterium alcoholitolerans]|uniref:HNH endonuclease signature motif containing protein n=1 Tax=unclassified Microbacterium TaxID=2609290 RepID=UPI003D178C88
MTFASEITDGAVALAELIGVDVEPEALTARASQLSDAEAVSVAEAAARIMRCAELAQVAAVGVIAARSARDAGQSGLAQSRGHRTAVSLVQQLTGTARADAARKVRVGEALVNEALAGETPAGGDVGTGVDRDADSGASADVNRPWDAPLSAALLGQAITAAQHDAIRLGLGAPVPSGGADGDAAASDDAREAWSLAAEQLVAEAGGRSLEELRSAARSIRDRLDPEGAHRRYLERFERRCFRLWTDADGNRRGSFLFDDEGGLLAQTVVDSALRPRRGGPRFVDSAERERAAQMIDDERTNDQLAYDLFLDVLRAGALADAETVFGTRQAGVRLVQVIDDTGAPTPTAHAEDGLTALPSAAAEQHICDSGYVPVTVDACGNPLDVGREHRLFTPRQRIALAIRDGGCRWPGCDRPASYCEAHHCDHWVEHEGRTDIDRGILLCRFHHMNLHHHGWRLTRNGKDDFVLHPPPGRGEDAIELRPRTALAYAWAGIDPPPRRFRQASS